MYNARIVFYYDNSKLELKNLNKEYQELFQQGVYHCKAKAEQSGRKTSVTIIFGEFETEDEAASEGENLLRHIKLEMCKQHNPIEISSKDGMLDTKESCISTGGLTEYAKNMIKENMGEELDNIEILNEKLGLSIIKADKNNVFFSSSVEGKIIKSFKLDYCKYKNWNEELDIVLSLLSSSLQINDVRIEFLLKIMAIESLVSSKQKKGEDYVNAIDYVIQNLKLDVDDDLAKQIKSDIGSLKNKSISKKCKDLVSKYCGDEVYADLEATKFFDKCYRMRSGLVHSGELASENFNKYNAALTDMVINIIEKIANED